MKAPECVERFSNNLDQYREPGKHGELLAVCSPVRVLGENVEAAVRVDRGEVCFEMVFEGFLLHRVGRGINAIGEGLGKLFGKKEEIPPIPNSHMVPPIDHGQIAEDTVLT